MLTKVAFILIASQLLIAHAGLEVPQGNTFIDQIHVRSRRQSDKRISETECENNSRHVRQKVKFLPLTAGATVQSTSFVKCDYDKIPLIVGGNITSVGEFPHMAVIGWTQPDRSVKWQCGGSLISADFILSAGHCFVELPKADVVRLGEQTLRDDFDGADPVDIEIESILSHPDYKYPSKYNDLALVKLKSPATFSNNVRPACLWFRNTINAEKTVATGWGTRAAYGDQNDELRKVTIDIIPNGECYDYYEDQIGRKLKMGIIDTQLCAGDRAGGKDTCQGDSGGPIQIAQKGNNCIFYVIGVTSFGSGCGVGGAPGVYTRVSKYIDWIEDNVWPSTPIIRNKGTTTTGSNNKGAYWFLSQRINH